MPIMRLWNHVFTIVMKIVVWGFPLKVCTLSRHIQKWARKIQRWFQNIVGKPPQLITLWLLFTRQQLPNQMYVNKPILIHTVTTIQFLFMFIKLICYPKTAAKFCLWVMPFFHCLWTGVSVWGSQHHRHCYC